VLFFLLFLGSTGASSNFARNTFEFSIFKYLKATNLLLLYRPKFLLFFCRKLGSVLCFNLSRTFVKNLLLFLLIKAFEVIGLYSMGSKHRLFCSGVLSHKVMVQSVVELNVCVYL
jgi:hypothetical protein